jgi:hypothetical protein
MEKQTKYFFPPQLVFIDNVFIHTWSSGLAPLRLPPYVKAAAGAALTVRPLPSF